MAILWPSGCSTLCPSHSDRQASCSPVSAQRSLRCPLCISLLLRPSPLLPAPLSPWLIKLLTISSWLNSETTQIITQLRKTILDGNHGHLQWRKLQLVKFQMDANLIYGANLHQEILNARELISMKIISAEWKRQLRKWFNCAVWKIDKGIKLV